MTKRQPIEDLGEKVGHFWLKFRLDLAMKAVHLVHNI